MRHHRVCTVTRHLTPFILAFMLLACGGSGNGSGGTGGTTPVPVTNGSKSENYIVYQDVAAATGGSTASTSFRLTATLGQSSPTGESSSAGYTLSGGSRPD